MADSDLAKTVLFPHGDIGERRARRLLAFFPNLAVCLPWYEEAPAWAEDIGISILYPPDQMKPPSDFRAILAQHRTMLEQDRAADYLAYAAAMETKEEPGFLQLAAMIREGRSMEPTFDQATRHNIIIHLYHETEKAEGSTQEWLDQIRIMPSPLKGAIEEATESPLLDLPPYLSEVSPSGARARQIIEAWCALFAAYLTPHTSLITLAPWVVETAFLMLGEEIMLDDEKRDSMHLILPKPVKPSSAVVHESLSGKPIILFRP